MPVQKDSQPGTREEDKIYMIPGTDTPVANGEFTYVSGTGFRFYEEGEEKGLTASGISEPQHENLDSLVHMISEDSYEEVTRSSGRVSNITYWTDSGKTKKIRETVLTRSSGRVSQVDEIQYDGDGIECQRMTGVITRSGGFVTDITWAETVP